MNEEERKMMKYLLLLITALALVCLALTAHAQAQVTFRDVSWELKEGYVLQSEIPIGIYQVQNLETQGRGFRSGRLKVFQILTWDGADLLVALSVPPPTRDEIVVCAAINRFGVWFPLDNRMYMFYGDKVLLFGTLGRIQ